MKQNKTPPLVVMLHSAVLARLPSMAERIGRALHRQFVDVKVVNGYSVLDTKNFEFEYNQAGLKCDVVIVVNSCYVVSAVQSEKKGSLWRHNSVRPNLSYFLDYADALYASWQVTGLIDHNAMRDLPMRCFGTRKHEDKAINEPQDEIFVCGQIVADILATLAERRAYETAV